MQAGDAADWVYKGEGAANLILSYTGSSPSMVCSALSRLVLLCCWVVLSFHVFTARFWTWYARHARMSLSLPRLVYRSGKLVA